MRRWFLSYNSRDVDLVGQIEAALIRKEPGAKIFFAPKNLRAGGYWLPQLAAEIAEATAFILFVGEHGIGPWQVLEYYEALDKRVKNPDFAVMLLLLDGQPAPGLPFLRQLHWIVAADPASEHTIAKLFDATAGGGSQPGELWRYTAPYRGLASMAETDSDFFFGRERETVTVLKALAAAPDKLPLLLGNSGVGKSSLAQAGVLAALARQAWPEQAAPAEAWPHSFADSRRWCVLKLQPGTDPIKALIEPFLRTWQLDPVDPEWEKRRKGWFDALINDEATLPGLLDATERQHEKLGQPKPPGFLLYIDQGEELYVRSTEAQRQAFSRLIGNGIKDPRLRAIMSLRSDFFGAFQNDDALYDAHQQINVGPLREAELYEVVCRPTALLGARFETESLAKDMARRTAAESVKDAGALPLLSYLLDDMWTQMVKRGDGLLRLPTQAIELGSVLADRANAFLARHPTAESQIMRIFTLKLATVREDGEPTRRRALRSEFSDDEWRRVSELADQPHRLLVVATPESGETYTEVAHESILRHWDKLHDWLVAEREFLIWKTQLELARRRWQQTPEASKNDALLMGLALSQAQGWLMSRLEDLSAVDREFIEASLNRHHLERRHRERLQRRVLFATVAGLLVAIVLGALATLQWREADRSRTTAEAARAEADRQRLLAEKEAKDATAQRNRALLNASRRLQQLADRALIESKPLEAALFALEGLPGPKAQEERPYLPELESVLYQAGTQLRELPPLSLATYPQDGRFVAVDAGGNPGVYDRASGERLLVLPGHTGRINVLAASRDAAAAGDDDGTVRLWDTATGRQVALFQVGCPVVRVLIIGKKSLFASCAGGTAKLWNIADASLQFAVSGHTGVVDYFTFNGDTHRGISYGEDKTALLWNTSTGREIAKFTVPAVKLEPGKADARRISALLSQDGRFAIISRYTNRWDSLVLDTATGGVLTHFDGDAYFTGPKDLVEHSTCCKPSHAGLWNPETQQKIFDEDANYTSDGDLELLWSKQSNTAQLWNTKTGTKIATLSAQAPIDSAALLAKTNRLFTGSTDGSIAFWDTQTGQLIARNADVPHQDTRTLLDGKRMLVSDDTSMTLWDTTTGSQIASPLKFKKYSFEVMEPARFAAVVDNQLQVFNADNGLALPKPDLKGVDFASDGSVVHDFSKEGQRGAFIIGATKARVWDVASGHTITDVTTPTGDISLIRFSDDGSKLLLHRGRNVIDIWSADSGLHLGRINDMPNYPDFGAKGDLMLLADDSGKPGRTRLWRMDVTSPMTSLWLGSPGKLHSVQFMADQPASRLVVARSAQPAFPFRAQVYDLASGKLAQQFTGPTDDFISDGISDDRRRFAAISKDGHARIWDLAGGYLVATVPAINGLVSHDWLLVAQQNWTRLQLWNIATGRMVFELPNLRERPGYWRFSADGRYLATSDAKGPVRLFETASGKQVALFAGADGFAFAPNSDRIFVRFADHHAILAEAATGRTLAEFPKWQLFVFTAHNSGAVLVEQPSNAATADALAARVIDAATGQTRVSLDLKGATPKSLEVGNDSDLVAIDIKTGPPRLFDTKTGEEVVLAGAKAEPPDTDQLSPDGRHLVATYGNAAVLFDTASKTSVPLHAHLDKIKSAAFSRNGRFVMTASEKDVWLTDIASGEARNLTGDPGGAVRFAVFSPDSNFVVSETDTPVLRVWNVATGKLVQSLPFAGNEVPWIDLYTAKGMLLVSVHRLFDFDANLVQILDQSGARIAAMPLSRPVSAVQMNADHTRMIAEANDGKVTVWDVQKTRLIRQSSGGRGEMSFAFSTDGRRFSGVIDNFGRNWSWRLWDADGRTIASQDSLSSGIYQLHSGFSTDSHRFWVAFTRYDFPPELHVFDAETGQAMTHTTLAANPKAKLLVSPAGDRALVYFYERGNAQLWDLAAAKQIATVPMIGDDSVATFSHDGSLLAAVSPEKSVKIWDTGSGALRITLPKSQNNISAITFSVDGRFLAVGASDQMVRVYDSAGGKLLHALAPSMSVDANVRSSYQKIAQIEFSDEGQKLMVRGSDLISVWNLATGAQTAAYPVQESNPATLSPDGRLLLVSKGYKMPLVINRLFDRVTDTVAAARGAVPRCLTPAERKASFLDPEPPNWCIEMQKPPYDTAVWRDWLAQKKAGHAMALPKNP